MEPSAFEFRAGPLRRPMRVEVSGARLTVRDADGAVRDEVDLSTATDVGYAELGARDTLSRWFDVEHPKGRLRIGCNTLTPEGPVEPDRDEFLAAVAAILLTVEREAPGLAVTIGTRGGSRWAMFAIGATALAVGLGLPVAALATGVRTEKLLAGLVPSALLILIGLALVLAHPPWRKAPRIPAGDFARALLLAREDSSSSAEPSAGRDVEGV